MNLALIPARGGSKRILRKNVREFQGKPIIAYAIEAARAAGCFGRIIVSTDDDEIADVATACGAETPFRRPAELADDHTSVLDATRHAIAWLSERDIAVDKVCMLYATAPFVRVAELLEGLELLTSSGADYCLPIARFPAPIQRAIKLAPNNRLSMFWPENFSMRSQDLTEAYHDAGQFLWGSTDAFLSGKPVFSSGTVPIVIPSWRVHDLDTEEDWRRAELLWAAMGDNGRD